MFKTPRGITVLVLAFALTLVVLHFLNRPRPVIAFERIATIPYREYNTFEFNTSRNTRIILDVQSDTGIKFDTFALGKSEYEYYQSITSGETPLTRPVDFLWESRGATSHRSPPLRIAEGSYILYVENGNAENTEKLPIKITMKGEDLLTER